MKKFNANIIVFVVAMLFIIIGFTGNYFGELKVVVKHLWENVSAGESDCISEFTNSVESVTTEGLRYHNTLMNLDSFKNKCLNTRIIEKEDTVLVKTDANSLVEPQDYILSDERLDETVDKISELQKICTKNSAGFLYVSVPSKGYDAAFPENVIDYNTENYDRFVSKMKNNGISVLDLKECMVKDGNVPEDVFFKTDHHWKPIVAFSATKSICEKLKTQYGFDFNKTYTDIENYSIKTYEDWFLGSYGKKVGESFVGVDDFDVITPKFETNLTEEQPFKNQIRTGTFEETVMDMNNVNRKDYYNLNPYAAYSGGDFRLQIMRNNLNPDGKKILIIRDSFACAVTPFLSLQTAELHIADIRNGDAYVGDKIDVYKYMEEIKPDFVIVLYKSSLGLSEDTGKFCFN